MLVDRLSDHPMFLNASHQQLPVWMQLAIFLNGLEHYGNAATTQDMTEWAGIAVGTVHNCYKPVMLALLHFHDMVIHFDPANHVDDHEEKKLAKAWIESMSCPAWRNGFLCVDGTTFNLFQKPGYHGEGFYDCKSCYSLSNQVCFNLFSIHFNLYFVVDCDSTPQFEDCRLYNWYFREHP